MELTPRALFLLLGIPGGACCGVFIEEKTLLDIRALLYTYRKNALACIDKFGLRCDGAVAGGCPR
jgi:hypothetical protein